MELDFFSPCECVTVKNLSLMSLSLIPAVAPSVLPPCFCSFTANVNKIERAPIVSYENSLNLVVSERSPGIPGPKVRNRYSRSAVVCAGLTIASVTGRTTHMSALEYTVFLKKTAHFCFSSIYLWLMLKERRLCSVFSSLHNSWK